MREADRVRGRIPGGWLFHDAPHPNPVHLDRRAARYEFGLDIENAQHRIGAVGCTEDLTHVFHGDQAVAGRQHEGAFDEVRRRR